MDFGELKYALDYLLSNGVSFSLEQRMAIQSSLALLRNDNHFEKVHFWGKIRGIDDDYMIAFGTGKDITKKRTFFYSLNWGLEWILLSTPNPEMMEYALAAKGLFTGDPTADSETELPLNNRDEIGEGEAWVSIKEEERLSAIVHLITNETMIVPRGALIKDPTGLVMENKTFEGLSKVEGSQLHSYYRIQPQPWDKNIVSRADFNVSLDFLDSIANDQPLGCWNIQIDRAENVANIRSLFWPGSFAFHCLGSQRYGWLYVGNGRKMNDLAFMISPPSSSAIASIPETGDAGDGDYREKGASSQNSNMSIPISLQGLSSEKDLNLESGTDYNGTETEYE